MIPTNQAVLHVISVISNPIRYATRIKLYKEFQHYMAQHHNVVHWCVEVAFGNRPFEVTEAGHPNHLQIRTIEELWHKENLINLGIERLPLDAQYVAWIDADVRFTRPDWVEETIHQLQHYQVVQMFSSARDLGPGLDTFNVHKGFVWSYHKKQLQGNAYDFWHPGYAWAANVEAVSLMGGLMAFPILGAADHHMALALIGKVEDSVPSNMSAGFLRELKIWQERCERYIRRDIGYVPGELMHYWHGKKKDRRYVERWGILTNNAFDPDTDIKRDYQGLWQLSDHGDIRSINLRDQIRHYFRQRNEDSIDQE